MGLQKSQTDAISDSNRQVKVKTETDKLSTQTNVTFATDAAVPEDCGGRSQTLDCTPYTEATCGNHLIIIEYFWYVYYYPCAYEDGKCDAFDGLKCAGPKYAERHST